MKAEFNNSIALLFIQSISKFLLITSSRLADFLQNFDLLLGTISQYKQMFFLADTPQKVENTAPSSNMFCVFLPFCCSFLVRNSAINILVFS